MLSDNAIKQAIQEGRLAVTYSNVPQDDGTWKTLSKAIKVNVDDDASRMFQEALTRSRLALSLGPLLKPLVTSARVKRSLRFANCKQVIDLRRATNGWLISPGASVVAFANEYVELSGDLVGFIVSRVSNLNSGLVVTASYLDSCWHGLIKLHLVNLGGRAVRVRMGDEVARLFFSATPDASQDDYSVAQQGIHYGLTWQKIFADRFDPFPKSGGDGPAFRTARLRNTNELLKDWVGYGAVAVLVASIGLGGRLYFEARESLDLTDQVDDLVARTGELEHGRALSGAETIEITSGSRTGTVRIDLDPATVTQGDRSFVFATSDAAAGDTSVTAELRQSSGGDVLVLSATLADPAPRDLTVVTDWMVVP